MIRQPHLKLIAGHSVRHGIRGGAGLVSLLLTLVLGLTLASVVISPLEMIDRQAERIGGDHGVDSAAVNAQMSTEVRKVARTALDFAMSPTDETLDYLTNDKPAIVSAILVLLFLVTPLLACMGGFNQTSGDIASKGLRFLLIRTERGNIFLGRFIGTFLFSAAVYLALFAILAIYMAAKVHVHPAGDMILWLGSGYLRLLILALPYTAMCALVSSSIDSPFGSLMVALLIAYVYPLFIRMASGAAEQASYLQYLSPWGYKWWLLAPMGGQFFGGIAAMLAFTGLFIFLGLKHFEARDL